MHFGVSEDACWAKSAGLNHGGWMDGDYGRVSIEVSRIERKHVGDAAPRHRCDEPGIVDLNARHGMRNKQAPPLVMSVFTVQARTQTVAPAPLLFGLLRRHSSHNRLWQ